MSLRQRKVEIHHLTLSGLPEGTGYGKFIKGLREKIKPVAHYVWKYGEKSHALYDAHIINHRLQLRFMSFTRGFRPDIFDTERFSLSENPLKPSQTGVEWTHILGGKKKDRYLLLIERNRSGIWPSALEGYFQWMVDRYYTLDDIEDSEDKEPVTVSLEAVPGEEFITKMNSLSRITEAVVRIVRPNPGWSDLETELGSISQNSDAHKTEIKMNARRRSSLKKNSGIILIITDLFRRNKLDYASITGRKDSRQETFNTAHLIDHSMISFETDDNGQLNHEDVWPKLSDMMDKME